MLEVRVIGLKYNLRISLLENIYCKFKSFAYGPSTCMIKKRKTEICKSVNWYIGYYAYTILTYSLFIFIKSIAIYKIKQVIIFNNTCNSTVETGYVIPIERTGYVLWREAR